MKYFTNWIVDKQYLSILFLEAKCFSLANFRDGILDIQLQIPLHEI